MVAKKSLNLHRRLQFPQSSSHPEAIVGSCHCFDATFNKSSFQIPKLSPYHVLPLLFRRRNLRIPFRTLTLHKCAGTQRTDVPYSTHLTHLHSTQNAPRPEPPPIFSDRYPWFLRVMIKKLGNTTGQPLVGWPMSFRRIFCT